MTRLQAIQELEEYIKAHTVMITCCPDQCIYQYGYDDPLCYAIEVALRDCEYVMNIYEDDGR